MTYHDHGHQIKTNPYKLAYNENIEIKLSGYNHLYSCACDIHPLREVYLIFREVYLKIVIAHGVQILSPLLQIGQISLY